MGITVTITCSRMMKKDRKIVIGQDYRKYYIAQEHAQHDYIIVRAM